MRKQEQEALRRLEAALMEQEHPQAEESEEFEDFEDFEDFPDEVSELDFHAYNTDITDVDLDAYSEDVHQGSQRNPLLGIFTVFSLLLLAASIYVLLKFLGVI